MREFDVNLAVDALAVAVERALRVSGEAHTNGNFSLRASMPGRNGRDEARLAALRVLGADALTPFVLAGHPFTEDDADLVCAAMVVHPPPDRPDPDRAALWNLRDWAVSSLLRRLRGRPLPEVPAIAGADPDQPWPSWTVRLARLSSLALPAIDSPLRTEVVARRLDLARGLTRALLRRDHLTAARLVRWQALDDILDPDPDLPAELGHLTVLTADNPRVRLEVTLAGLLMGRQR